MEKIDFKKQNIPFTQVANGVLNDAQLSAKAKGLYAYFYSKPDGWDFAISRIQKEMIDGRDAIQAGINELEKHGYLKRYKQPNGRMIYVVIFPPLEPVTENPSLAQEPVTEKPNHGKTQPRKTRSISNKDIEVINIRQSNTESAPSSGNEVQKFISLFGGINPSYGELFKRKPQREASARLLKIHPVDWWERFIAAYLTRLGDRFCPKATTPAQMEDKFAAIMAYGRSLQTSDKGKGIV